MRKRMLHITGIFLIIIGVILLVVPVLPGLVPLWIGIGMVFPKHRERIREKLTHLFRKK